MPVKKRVGIVVSNKMDKTVVVKVETRLPHSRYSKIISKTKKYLAHDSVNECNVGDQVLIQETRPLSKRKHWEIKNIICKFPLNN